MSGGLLMVKQKVISKTFTEWIDVIKNEVDFKNTFFEFNSGKLKAETVSNFYYRYLKKRYGDYVIARAIDVTDFKDSNGVKIMKVESEIHECINENYDVCPHPLDTSENWFISSIINYDRFNHKLKKGDLFNARFLPEKHDNHLDELITLDLASVKEITVSFEERLRMYGGNSLIEAAFELFGTNIEKNLVDKLLYLSEDAQYILEQTAKDLDEKEKDLKRRKKLFHHSKQNLSKEEKEWSKILKRLDRYLLLESSDAEELDEGNLYEWIPNQSISLLQSLIYNNSIDNLIYEEDTIEMFLRGMQTSSLVIFSGPSGTGKTSIVQAVADAIRGARVHMIPVQSSWTDTQDLVGFFNPVEKSFIPSPFLEAILEAQNDSENLHIICLDEMNLAHVEYYFSEFLSILEQKKRFIRLYSKRYFNQAKQQQNDKKNISKELDFNSMTLMDYPYHFYIPSNVRFVGTLNMDHTVKPISPKVIDRSFIIEIGHLSIKRKSELKRKIEANYKKGKIGVSLSSFEEKQKTEEQSKDSLDKIISLSEKLESIPNASLNSRGIKKAAQYLMYSNIEADYQIDQLIYSKILPRIELSKREEEGIQVLKDFLQSITKYKLSHQKLKEMLKDERLVGFW